MTEIVPRPMLMQEFEPLVGQTFLADCEPKVAELVLLSVEPSKFVPDNSRTPFTLIFRSPPEILLVAGLYAMRSAGLEPATIYIEQTSPPATGATGGHYYQAVFN